MRPVVRRLVVIAACAAMTTGCGNRVDGHGPEVTQLDGLIDEQLARSDLDPVARDLLESTRGKSELAFEAYETAVNAYLGCVRSLGFRVKAFSTDSEGRPDFYYAMEYPSGVSSERDPGYRSLTDGAQKCQRTLLFPVSIVYAAQPVALESREKYFEKFREPTWECLRQHDTQIEQGASVTDYVAESSRIEDAVGINCLYNAGYYPEQVVPDEW